MFYIVLEKNQPYMWHVTISQNDDNDDDEFQNASNAKKLQLLFSGATYIKMDFGMHFNLVS